MKWYDRSRRYVAGRIEYWTRFTPRALTNSILGVLGFLFLLFTVLLLFACTPQKDQKIQDSERVRYDQFRIRCVSAGGTPTGTICLKNGNVLPIFP